jgi:hypothetical protein
LELSDAGNLAEVKKVLTLGLVPRPTSDWCAYVYADPLHYLRGPPDYRGPHVVNHCDKTLAARTDKFNLRTWNWIPTFEPQLCYIQV